ncbi:S-layer homology domain-containing protein [Peptoniphilus duerdenii]|uniref:S-layer homology domain-containing protein n=1 Tax=Peptoniphilus duerdenii TaxID=507750 RepID=UPI00254FDAAB|nr:S-layer homology domain-containing protein [Peptoniphilus duerdenii]MDK8276902.1 S-layer homology domain-containing protein [Peptoniphilus duerdenii]
MKKTLSLFLAVIMIIGMMPLQALAEGEPAGGGGVTYPLTLKVYNPDDGSFKEKTFNSKNDLLGFGINHGGRNDWTYRTFRKLFFGWSIDEKFKNSTPSQSMKPDDKIYRDIEPISAIEGLKNDSVLYPITMPVTDLMAFAKMLETGGGALYINKNVENSDIISKTAIKKVIYKEPVIEDNKINKQGKKLIVSYFDPEKDEYEIQAVSEFYFQDPRVPFVMVENPLGIIKSAKGVTDFTEKNPQNYSYEDLIVELDDRFIVAESQKDWTFESATFIVSDVLYFDEAADKYVSLNPDIKLPSPDSLITTFSFDNPNKLKKFIIRTTPRSDNSDAKYGSDQSYPTDNTTVVTGQQILQPMKLKTGKGSNIKILKDYARELEANKSLESISNGKIKGAVGIDKRRMTGGAAVIAYFLPNSQAIKERPSDNTMDFDFAIPIVRFDKNTKASGDNEEQNLGYSKFVVNKAMDSDEFDQDTQPNKDIKQAGEAFIDEKDYKVGETKLLLNGKELTFRGWNTQKDGSGKYIKKDTVIKYEDLNQRLNDAVEEDITLYAIWESKEPKPEPKPEPQPEYNPFWPIYFGSTKKVEDVKDKEIHKAYIFGYTDKTVKGNGNLTRAEAAAMVTRLANLDLSDKSKADYNDLQEGAWYLPNINAALKAGMIDATDKNLRPDDKITRGEFAKMLAAIDKDNDYVSSFSDIKGHKYEKEISKIDGNKRIEGYQDGTFKPDGFLTRAEAASFLNRMFNRVADDVAIEDLVNSIIPFKDLSKNDWFYFEIVEATNTHELYRRGGSDKFERAFEKWLSVLN